MDIRASKEGEAILLAPDGSLAGAEETSALEAKLAAVHKAGARQLVVDCTRVGTLTSAAIRALLLSARKLTRAQGRLVLFGMNAKVKKAFAISGFDQDFTVVDTRDEALRRVAEPVQPVAQAPKPTVVAAPPVADVPPAPALAPAAPPASVRAPGPDSAPAPTRAPRPDPAPAPPVSPPAADPREVLANSLLEALGVRVVPPIAAKSARAGDEAAEAVAAALLSALGATRG
jgi:anti-anti-sigma factor